MNLISMQQIAELLYMSKSKASITIKQHNIKCKCVINKAFMYDKSDIDELIEILKTKDNNDYISSYAISDIINEQFSSIAIYLRSIDADFITSSNMKFYHKSNLESVKYYFSDEQKEKRKREKVNKMLSARKLLESKAFVDDYVKPHPHAVKPMNDKFKMLCSNLWVSKRLKHIVSNENCRCIC